MDLLPHPSACFLGIKLVGKEPHNTETLHLTTEFKDPQEPFPQELLETVTGARIDFVPSPDREGYLRILLTAVHDCGAEGCPILTGRLAFELPEGPAAQLEAIHKATPTFTWYCTAPDYEAQLLVSGTSLRITSCQITQRSDTPTFTWYCTAPDYEAQLLVSGTSLRITSCQITQRSVH
jgi:hypothetical protein